MATVCQLKSLQELCLTHIIMTLEQYSTDVLSLLPKKFREQLLRNLPVLDVCRLEEDSLFTTGIDMESVWKELYSTLICHVQSSVPNLIGRELFFSRFFNAVIQGDRPYGYCDILSSGRRYTSRDSHKMNENQPVSDHDIDFVNFLVATKHDVPGTKDVDTRKDRYNRHSIYRELVTMNHHEVTLVKGLVPPGHIYHESCCINQLIPLRYAKLFPEDSCYLPDSTALQLITDKCHFKPKQLHIDVSTFATFLLNMEKECGSINCLKGHFDKIESVSIKGIMERSSGARPEECTGVAGQALELILQSSNPVLTSLALDLGTQDDILDSIQPVLVSYGGLKNFSLEFYSDVVSLNYLTLSSIVKHQPLLSVSISICALDEHTVLSQEFSEIDFVSWIQVCFKNPSLQGLKLHMSPTTLQLVMHIITVFLSVPCFHEQTLTFFRMDPGAPWLASTHMWKPRLSMASSTSSSTPVQSSDPPPTYQFDDALTFKYKCVTFDTCTIHNFLTKAFLTLAPLKLKKLSLRKIFPFNPTILFAQQAQDPQIEMESLELLFPKFPYRKNVMDSLSPKKLLKSIKISCVNKFIQEFIDLDVEHFDKKLISEYSEGKIFIFSRK